MMDIFFDRNNKVITWEYCGNKVSIKKENAIYAFEHGRSTIMIRGRVDGNSSFSLYDYSGETILEYISNSNVLFLKKLSLEIEDGKIICGDYDEEQNCLLVLVAYGDDIRLMFYNTKGERIGILNQPNQFRFTSLKNRKGIVCVTARGLSDQVTDNFGRNDWCFDIEYDSIRLGERKIIE